ncbi:hypothetical protein [Nonomuraea sp. NPDC049709]|uniref:hypothetical protein n=1 Tax=Nonomuraea sp. NPDC049709 TaxID=3154736 RepID=UPI00343311A8
MGIGEALALRRKDMHLLPDSQVLGCRHEGPHVHVHRRLNAQRRVRQGAAAAGDPGGARHDRGVFALPVRADEVGEATGADMGSDLVFVNLFHPRWASR